MRMGLLVSVLVVVHSACAGEYDETAARDLLNKGFLEQCIETLDGARAKTPSAALIRAKALIGLGDRRGAITELSNFVEIEETPVEAQFIRGRCYYELAQYANALADFDASLERCHDLGVTRYYRGLCSLYLGDQAGAIKDLQAGTGHATFPDEGYLVLSTLFLQTQRPNEASQLLTTLIERAPDSVQAYYYRAIARRMCAQRELMLADLRKLVEIDAGQAGGYSTTWREQPVQIDAAARRHAETQLQNLLKDRPAVAPFVIEGTDIYRFILEHFGGRFLENRMLWDPSAPADGVLADHVPPRKEFPGRIRFLATDPKTTAALSAESQIAHLLFELFNAENASSHPQIADRARRHLLTRDGFVYETAKLEYEACLRLRAFYLDVVEPWSKRQGILTTPDHWFGFEPPAFDQRFRQFQDRTQYPWSNYGAYYDAKISVEQNVKQGEGAGGEGIVP
ncbi:MAG: hypothetical protein H6823_18755 [Planctomycetaceae bacterium]|nr:hypothetical protein [Planctomycetaceae bacterium]